MWVARDKKNNRLCLFLVKPIKSTTRYLGFDIFGSKNVWKTTNPRGFIGYIDDYEMFNELSFNDEPIEVVLNRVSTNNNVVRDLKINVNLLDNDNKKLKQNNNLLIDVNNRLKTHIKHLKQKISKLCNPNNNEFIDIMKLIIDNDELKKKNEQLNRQVLHLKRKISNLCNPNNKSVKNN